MATDREIELLADAIARYQRWQHERLELKEKLRFERGIRRQQKKEVAQLLGEPKVPA